jgi:glutamyl endopeptidase
LKKELMYTVLRELCAVSRIGPSYEWWQIEDTTIYPYRAVVYLQTTWKDNSVYGGTAFFIGPYTLVTAGHNLWSRNPDDPTHGWVKSIKVIPGRNDASYPFGSIMASNWDVPYEFVHDADQSYDYGLIVIRKPLGNLTSWFSFHAMGDDNLLNTTEAYVCGYRQGGTMWCDTGRVTNIDDLNVYYDMDTEATQSGSPVYYKYGDTCYAFAIHNFGESRPGWGNSGARITYSLYSWMKAWKDNPSFG